MENKQKHVQCDTAILFPACRIV